MMVYWAILPFLDKMNVRKRTTMNKAKTQKTTDSSYLVDVMTPSQKKQFFVLLAVWVGVLVYYLHWWFDDSHLSTYFGLILNSAVLLWTTVIPGYFFFFVARMMKSNPQLPLPQARVAMIVTKTPSEPLAVIQTTLQAMLMQNYPHDTWVADEQPTEESLQWYKDNGVHVSTRFGVQDYHRTQWPRRTKTKEGNLAYFYDHFGYEKYDIVVQLDADHVPQKGYLEEMVRPFNNPQVDYVTAPSICSANASSSWSARGRLYIEAFLHSAQQAGHSNGFAPLCFGSHYAVRTKALKEIGGLGPELAEDHSTTLMMNANGWKGVHAMEAIAIGDGPTTFADAMTQEFQWSRSLMIILLSMTPKYLHKLSWRLRFQFLFSQIWYPLFGLIMLLSYAIPLLALILNHSLVRMSYFEFLAHSWINLIATLAIVIWIKRQGWLYPRNSKLLSWETIIFQLVRWPWVLIGCTYGVIGFIGKKQFSFKVTPKGGDEEAPLPFKVLSPYIALVMMSFFTGMFVTNATNAQGYYYFLIMNLLIYTIIVGVIITKHIHEPSLKKNRSVLKDLNYENI